jgi:hypothetical protein
MDIMTFDWEMWSGFSWLRTGTGSGEHGDEPSGSGTTELRS